MSEQSTIRLGDVIIDPEYQIRKKLNPQFVNLYAEAMVLGHEFPPIVLEEGTNKTVCGFTRMGGYRKTFDPDHEIPVVKRYFENAEERIKFAAHDNSQHGQPLESFDIKNVMCKLRPSGITDEELSMVFGISLSRVRKLAGQTVVVIGENMGFVEERYDRGSDTPLAELEDNGQETLEDVQEDVSRYIRVTKPLKHGLKHLIGMEIPVSVYRNIEDHYMPQYVVTLCDQIVMRIDDGTINTDSSAELQAMKVLHEKLDAFLAN